MPQLHLRTKEALFCSILKRHLGAAAGVIASLICTSLFTPGSNSRHTGMGRVSKKRTTARGQQGANGRFGAAPAEPSTGNTVAGQHDCDDREWWAGSGPDSSAGSGAASGGGDGGDEIQEPELFRASNAGCAPGVIA